jgi:branched-chain amino acid transport system substrate-binding protein
MFSFNRLPAVLLGLSLAASSAWSQNKYGPGVTDSEIKIGNTAPYSGPASAYGVYGKAIDAYLKMINERGGINGRKITFISYDDQFSPPRTVEVVRRLVEQDQVLAIFSLIGSASNSAINRYVNARKVPHLFLGVGGEKFNDPKNYPWTVPFNPAYEFEGRLYAANILKTNPGAKVAVLYQNDDMGKDLLKALKSGFGDKAKDVIAAEASFEIADPTVDSQVVQLKASGADVFVFFGTSRPAAQAIRKVYDLGWKPQRYLTYPAAFVKSTFEPAGVEKSLGILSVGFTKDPAQPRWDQDAETKEYKEFLKKYLPEADVNDGVALNGYLQGQLIAHVLRSAGNDLTRENVLNQATHLKDVRLSMLLPGITLNNSPTNYYPFQTLQPMRFNGKELEPVGNLERLK